MVLPVSPRRSLLFVALWLLGPSLLWAQQPVSDSTRAALDAFWETAARTVRTGDFEGYAALYHEDAVLVNGLSGRSYPIEKALQQWKPGFAATRRGERTARVSFRFTERRLGASTAHVTGIFRYAAAPEGTSPTPSYIHFEALLVRTQGAWQWLMEYQKARATAAEWDAAASPH
ncbi:YybH family protein [Salisaeta longa]|uniref:YybH family protein n=1 Tax=Salisaeta longa TaxID=503170 RepID=UPI0003B75A02|nr:nuclear transport factor 2 family protein [Salisaeta longa]